MVGRSGSDAICVLIMEDPEAPGGVFRRGGLYDIAGHRRMLPKGVDHYVKTEMLGHRWNDCQRLRCDGPELPDGHATHPRLAGEAVLTGTHSSRQHKS